MTKSVEGMGDRIDDMGKRIDDLQGRINLTLNLVIGGIISFGISLVLFIAGYITKPLWEEKLPWRGKTTTDIQDETSEEDKKITDEISGDRLFEDDLAEGETG